jgi:hypothetical protein
VRRDVDDIALSSVLSASQRHLDLSPVIKKNFFPELGNPDLS